MRYFSDSRPIHQGSASTIWGSIRFAAGWAASLIGMLCRGGKAWGFGFQAGLPLGGLTPGSEDSRIYEMVLRGVELPKSP
jgi:hypothetical protein